MTFLRLSSFGLFFRFISGAAFVAALFLTTARACSVCGCSLSSDWASQGYGMMQGLQADVRYEYYDQNDLRTGTGEANRSAFVYPNTQEVQQETLNRSAWLDLDYVSSPAWGWTLQVPSYSRFHTTIAPGDSDVSTSRTQGFGDVRIMGRYQRFTPLKSFSFQFGLKLPTGTFDQVFVSGPAAGSLLDRGLQLGSGTTDLLAGLSWFSRPRLTIGCFAQVMIDQPLASREGFIPGTSLTLNGGLRYLNKGWLTPQLQVNARVDGREHGQQADTFDSGDTALYLSPGLTAEVGTGASLFAFFQLPIYQSVHGLQLEPRWLVSVGIRLTLSGKGMP